MDALLIVDIQYDFLPGGALGVPGGDEIVPVVRDLIPVFSFVVATQDWHPRDHESFAVHHEDRAPGDVIDLHGVEQVLWPVHCVQRTHGAEIAIELPEGTRVFRKGSDRSVDSYSGFFDNARRHDTGLSGHLRDHGVERVFVAGLATDYCVQFTVLDAIEQGFTTTVIADACRGVELHEGDVACALDAMRAAGAEIVESRDLLRAR